MDDIITTLNVASRFALSAVCVWAVLSHRVFDGIIIKFGLIAMAMGFFGSASAMLAGHLWFSFPALMRAELLINGGLLVVVMGIYLRYFCGKKARTRRRRPLTDFSWFAECPESPWESRR